MFKNDILKYRKNIKLKILYIYIYIIYIYIYIYICHSKFQVQDHFRLMRPILGHSVAHNSIISQNLLKRI